MAITFVDAHEAHSTTGIQGTNTASVTIATTSGDSLVVFVGILDTAGAGGGIVTLSDGHNTYTVIDRNGPNPQDANSNGATYYTLNVGTVASLVISLSVTLCTYVELIVLRYSGVKTTAALDGHNFAAGNSTTPSSGVASGTSGDTLIGFCQAQIAPGVGTSYNSRQTGSYATFYHTLAEDIVASGNQAAVFTLSPSNKWLAFAVMLIPAGSAGVTAPHMLMQLGVY